MSAAVSRRTDRATDEARWARRAVWLVAGTMAYNVVEAGVALWAGVAAGSIALVGFGLDSVIESAAAAVVLRRVAATRRDLDADEVDRTERFARRFIGWTFFALAAYVTLQSAWTLTRGVPVEESPLGIALAILSLVLMPLLAWGKLRAADALDSRALAAEAKETLACAWLSLALLIGLVANAAAGWTWADPVAALVMVPWLIHEGRESLEEAEDEDGEPAGPGPEPEEVDAR